MKWRKPNAPHPDAWRHVLPSDHRPADFPSRLPFVPNQAVSFAETEERACCSYPVLPPGAHPAAQAPRGRGMRDVVIKVRGALATAASIMDGSTAANADVDELFDRIVAAAADLGWRPREIDPEPLPPSWRHLSLARPGERLEIMSFVDVITVWSRHGEDEGEPG